MTREELKAHCEQQIAKCEALYAHDDKMLNSNRLYQEHKLILELLEQEPKTAHWIRWYEKVEEEYGTMFDSHCKCSGCNTEIEPYTSKFVNFCPKCGARIVEPQESEEKA